MDVFCKRFPLESNIIFKNLDYQTLTRSKEASRKIDTVIRNTKIFWIRMIKNQREYFIGHEESWKKIIKKAPITNVRPLAIELTAEVSDGNPFFKLGNFI